MSGQVGQRFGLVTREVMATLSRQPPIASRIYLALALHADAEGVCYPSRKAIAETAGTSEEVTRKMLRALERAGVVETLRRGSGHACSTYRLPLHPLGGGPKGGGLQIGGGPQIGVRPQSLDPSDPNLSTPVTYQGTHHGTHQKKPTARKTRLPDEFALTEERKAYAAGKGCAQPTRTFEAFVGYYRGSGKLQLDWEATWRTWVLGAHGGPDWKACGCGGAPTDRPRPRVLAAGGVPMLTYEESLARRRAEGRV